MFCHELYNSIANHAYPTHNEMVEFKILMAVRRAHSKLTTLEFKKPKFLLFRYLLGRVPWDKALEGRGGQESWLIFKDHLLQDHK